MGNQEVNDSSIDINNEESTSKELKQIESNKEVIEIVSEVKKEGTLPVKDEVIVTLPEEKIDSTIIVIEPLVKTEAKELILSQPIQEKSKDIPESKITVESTLDKINSQLDKINKKTDYSSFYEKYKIEINKITKEEKVEILIKDDKNTSQTSSEDKPIKKEENIEEIKNVQINSIKERATMEAQERLEENSLEEGAYDSGKTKFYYGNGIEEEGAVEEIDEPLY